MRSGQTAAQANESFKAFGTPKDANGPTKLDEPSIWRFLDDLNSEDIGVRDQADKRLRSMGAAIVPTLMRACDLEGNVDRRARIRLILQDLLTEEANGCLSRGLLDEAIVKLSQARGERDPEQFMGRLTKEMTQYIKSIYHDDGAPPVPECGGDPEGARAREFQKRFGWFGVRFLLDAALSEGSYRHMGRVWLAKMGPALVPVITHEIKKERLQPRRFLSLWDIPREILESREPVDDRSAHMESEQSRAEDETSRRRAMCDIALVAFREILEDKSVPDVVRNAAIRQYRMIAGPGNHPEPDDR